jgi:hypothetical protein
VAVEGFEVNGNAQMLTMPEGDVDEPEGSNCLIVTGSHNVTLRNLRLHHAWADGISIWSCPGFLDT